MRGSRRFYADRTETIRKVSKKPTQPPIKSKVQKKKEVDHTLDKLAKGFKKTEPVVKKSKRKRSPRPTPVLTSFTTLSEEEV